MSVHGTDISRRTLLKGAAGLVIGVHLAPGAMWARSAAAASEPFAPNAFVRIGTDDTVTVLVKHIEFGQGPLTGLTTLVAEELDADWSQMRAEHAPADAEKYKNLHFGIQGTGGSSAIANSYEQMRKAGAAARAMLIAAAAESWGVPPEEITVEMGVIRHEGSNRKARFGEFAQAAAGRPVPSDVPLKSPTDFKLVGRGDGTVGRLDSEAKSTGKARFTMDIRHPEALTVVVARPPRFGAKVGSFDATEAMKVRGVVDVKQVPSGVAVFAKGTWPAIKGRKKLDVRWDETGAETRSTEEIVAEYRERSRGPGAIASAHGDAEAALEDADTVVEAEFVLPYLAHATMEPLDGYLEFDGESALARYGSQLQTPELHTIAKVLGLPPEKVRLETMLAGGSFGRRGQADSHFAAELANVAKAIGPGRPVKLVWTREDDIQGGYYRPLVLHRMRGGLKDGKIVAWSNTVVTQSIVKGTPFADFLVKDGIDGSSVEGSRELPYGLGNFKCDLHTTDVAVQPQFWRSVGHSHTGYVVECFVDELLEAAGKDPVEGRLELLGNSPREAGALRAVAELANWSGPGAGNGRARGVAVVKSFGSYVAQIAEVSLPDNGVPRVHKVWCAVDCGVAVNPDVIRAQMESGIGYGLGHVLFAEVTLEEGRPVQGNFDTYRSLRINEMPAVEVAIVQSSEAPTGVGEPGLPPVGPAVANALARLAGERPRRLPIVRGTV